MDNSVVIPLTRGYEATVDRDDIELLSTYKWVTGGTDGRPYAVSSIKTAAGWTTIAMHRVVSKAPPGVVVDHINGNGLDNRKSNLRICTVAQNGQYRTRLGVRNTSGYMGVSRGYKGKWDAGITVGGKKHNLGSFACPIEAAIARDVAAITLSGDFAYLNFPDLHNIFNTGTEHGYDY